MDKTDDDGLVVPGDWAVRRRQMTAAEIREEYGCSPTMERKLRIEREKNVWMRSVVDVIRHPTDR